MKTFIFSILLICSTLQAQTKFTVELNTGVNILTNENITYQNDSGIETGGDVNVLNKEAYFYIQVLGNYYLNQYFSLGIGFESNRLDEFSLNSFIGNAKLLYPTRYLIPFINIDCGYSINTQNNVDGGFQYAIGLGLGLNVSSNIDLTIKGNYKVMNTETGAKDYTGILGTKTKYDFVNLTAGINYNF